MNPEPPTTHHRDRYRFRSIPVGTSRTGCTQLEAQAANIFSAQNKSGIKLIRRKQADGSYTIWRLA
jgi:hypothetical protein